MLPDADESAESPHTSLGDGSQQPGHVASVAPATDSGRVRAEVNADAWWWQPAMTAMRSLAGAGTTFTAEHLGMLGVTEPDDPCRVGSLFSAAYRTGLIEPSGAVIGLDGRARRVWRGARP